jgi:hypothetical protein
MKALSHHGPLTKRTLGFAQTFATALSLLLDEIMAA